MVELPDEFDRAFAFVTHMASLAEVGEWQCETFVPLPFAGENQDFVIFILVVDQILAGRAGLSGIRLRLPMDALSADRVVRIHRAWGKLVFCFLKSD